MIKSRDIHSVLLLLLAFVTISYAQNDLSFDHLSIKDGLSQSDVNDVYQDRTG